MDESCLHIKESCRTFVATVPNVAADDNMCMNESCPAYEWVMVHV